MATTATRLEEMKARAETAATSEVTDPATQRSLAEQVAEAVQGAVGSVQGYFARAEREGEGEEGREAAEQVGDDNDKADIELFKPGCTREIAADLSKMVAQAAQDSAHAAWLAAKSKAQLAVQTVIPADGESKIPADNTAPHGESKIPVDNTAPHGEGRNPSPPRSSQPNAKS
ncbi:hypothetical protein DIPPA_31516 [Diplonema papillatum]|nr:hypothetical protein DIPPA_31516 [Diplonema papillatum]|eukprot:gene9760-15151_t